MTNASSRPTSEETARDVGLPWSVAQPTLVAYRSVGIGVFGACARFAGMPLEKIALYMNSSQVSGKGQFGQAIRLTFAEGALAPYRVVGPASLTAWFLQYSVMGIAFQFVDQTLSHLMGVRPVYYGRELMEPPVPEHANEPLHYQLRITAKQIMSPMLAACMESFVSNRAEAQRFFGPAKFAPIEQALRANALLRQAGPAFFPSAMRNTIMCQTSFLLTPVTYKLYFPQEFKNKTTLFWYGLSLNIFVGNVVAITQQALWGRSLDYLSQHGRIEYAKVIQNGYSKEGIAAFFTLPKWFSRVLMNAPAQGTLPWFYNEILPLAEPTVLTATRFVLYDLLSSSSNNEDAPSSSGPPQRRFSSRNLQRQRSNYGSLPTAHPEISKRDRSEVNVALAVTHLHHHPTHKHNNTNNAKFTASSPR